MTLPWLYLFTILFGFVYLVFTSHLALYRLYCDEYLEGQRKPVHSVSLRFEVVLTKRIQLELS